MQKVLSFFMRDFLLELIPLDSISAESLFKKNRDIILHALKICDSNITEIDFVKDKIKMPEIPMAGIEQITGQMPKEIEIIRFTTIHKHDKSARFDLQTEESVNVNTKMHKSAKVKMYKSAKIVS